MLRKPTFHTYIGENIAVIVELSHQNEYGVTIALNTHNSQSLTIQEAQQLQSVLEDAKAYIRWLTKQSHKEE